MNNSSKAQNAKLVVCALHSSLILLVGLLPSPIFCQTVPGQQIETSASKDEYSRAVAGKAGSAPLVVAPKPIINSASADTSAILRSARVIYVRSSSLLVGASVVEDKLQKRPEFQQLGLLITRDELAADLILELRHDLFTMYVFTVIDTKTQVVVASGKLSSLGGTVAGKVAERFLKQLLQVRQGK
jgi:hypothetical protein